MALYDWQMTLMTTALRFEAHETACILRAVFGWRFVDPLETTMTSLVDAEDPRPAAGRYADITPDGWVLTHWVTPDGKWSVVDVGTVETFRDNMRRLADTAQISDPDRQTFETELRKWIRNDYRPQASGEWSGPSKALDHS